MKICTGGLTMSSGEYAVMKVLDDMDVRYDREVSELKNEDGGWLRFDFKITHEASVLYVEYDGRQHFEPRRFGGMSDEQAAAAFAKCQRHATLKNEWCSDNGHPLLRITYKQFGSVGQLITAFMVEHTAWGVEDC
jgi:hypothetical protein